MCCVWPESPACLGAAWCAQLGPGAPVGAGGGPGRPSPSPGEGGTHRRAGLQAQVDALVQAAPLLGGLLLALELGAQQAQAGPHRPVGMGSGWARAGGRQAWPSALPVTHLWCIGAPAGSREGPTSFWAKTPQGTRSCRALGCVFGGGCAEPWHRPPLPASRLGRQGPASWAAAKGARALVFPPGQQAGDRLLCERPSSCWGQGRRARLPQLLPWAWGGGGGRQCPDSAFRPQGPAGSALSPGSGGRDPVSHRLGSCRCPACSPRPHG